MRNGDGAEYRQFADECRKLATTAATPEHKKMLEEMAAAWDNVAKRRRDQLAKEAAPHPLAGCPQQVYKAKMTVTGQKAK